MLWLLLQGRVMMSKEVVEMVLVVVVVMLWGAVLWALLGLWGGVH